MASDEPRPVKVTIPRDMRPRSTPNAEINHQNIDNWRYDQGIYERPAVKDVPPRGYKKGGPVSKGGYPAVGVKAYCAGGKVLSSKKY